MEIWHLWTSLLTSGIAFLSSHFGVSEAIAIITLTIAARVALMPVSLVASFRMEMNKRKMHCIKPELDALKLKHKDNSSELAAATMRLYRDSGVTFLDRLTILNIGTQGIFGLGIFQALGKAGFTSKFLWIGNIAKPDFPLTVLVGVIMFLGMVIMPGTSVEPSMLVMICVSIAVAVAAVAAMPSAIGLYWAASNAVTVVQTLALRVLINRQPRPAA